MSKKAVVIHGAAASVSPPIGDMANNNASNFFDLPSRFGKGAGTDALVIAGDLYDHLHNYEPSFFATVYVASMKSIHARQYSGLGAGLGQGQEADCPYTNTAVLIPRETPWRPQR